MSGTTRSLASIFLDLEAASDLSSSEDEEELDEEGGCFGDFYVVATHARAS